MLRTSYLFTTTCLLALLSWITPAHAQTLRYMGIDINTEARKPADTSTTVTNTRVFSSSVGTLAGLATLGPLAGTEISAGAFTPAPFSATSGTSAATSSYNINSITKTFSFGAVDHHVLGTPSSPAGDNILTSTPGANFAGSEGAVYFYALTPGTLKVTYDYDAPTEEYPTLPTDPYKPQNRGRSRCYIFKNSKGTSSADVPDESFDPRTGSVTFFESVAPSDDLITLQFDLRLWDGSAPSSVTSGFATMEFTPAPEPASAMLLAVGGMGLLTQLRRGRRRS